MNDLTRGQRPLLGLALAGTAYGLFALQDAVVKWLVASYSVPQILFMRSLVIIAVAVAIGGAPAVTNVGSSRAFPVLIARSVLILAAWLTYYYAARTLGLAELTTLYFVAPIIVVLQAALLLKERVTRGRWLAVVVGFAGVAIAAGPASPGSIVPVFLVLFAATCWASSMVLTRVANRTDTSTSQMVVSNAIFALACAAALPFLWVTPSWSALGLMLFLGVAGGLAQFALFESYRFALASVIAPIEYTALVWAFVLGYLIWSDIPAPQVFLGAACIVGTCLALVWSESRTLARARPAGQ